MQGFGFKVQGVELRAQGYGFRDVGFTAPAFGFRV